MCAGYFRRVLDSAVLRSTHLFRAMRGSRGLRTPFTVLGDNSSGNAMYCSWKQPGSLRRACDVWSLRGEYSLNVMSI
jgi:hypothetical protein